MFERFTHEARRVVVGAQREAASLNHDRIGTEHILLALMSERAGVGSRVLTELGLERERTRSALLETLEARGSKRQGSDRLSEPDPDALATIGIDLDAVRGAVEETFGPGALERTRARRGRATGREPRPGHRPFTPRAKKVMELSLREAIALRHRHIGTEHLLLAIVREGEGLAALLWSAPAWIQPQSVVVCSRRSRAAPIQRADGASKETSSRWSTRTRTHRRAESFAVAP